MQIGSRCDNIQCNYNFGVGMKIIVCVKQVLDTAAQIQIDNGGIVSPGVPALLILMMSLRLKKQYASKKKNRILRSPFYR